MLTEVVLEDGGRIWKERGLISFEGSVGLLSLIEVGFVGFGGVCEKLAGEEVGVINGELIVFVTCWGKTWLGGE